LGGESISTQSRYIAIETIISILINVIISALFMLAVFGRSEHIDLWGLHGLALDFVPQTFMITLMSVLVPTALTRRRLRERRIVGYASTQSARWPSSMWVRALLIAVALTVMLGGAALWILTASWNGPLSYWRAFPLKLLYGALVALIATPLGLRIALSEKMGST
jgi:hypothetical protein